MTVLMILMFFCVGYKPLFIEVLKCQKLSWHYGCFTFFKNKRVKLSATSPKTLMIFFRGLEPWRGKYDGLTQ